MNGPGNAQDMKTLASIGRSVSNASSLTTLCTDISPSSSHFFEVLYIGKIRIPNRKVTEAFIDIALVKFRQLELHNNLANVGYHNARRPSQGPELKLSDIDIDKCASSSTLNQVTENRIRDADFGPRKDSVKYEIERFRANSIASMSVTKQDSTTNNGDMEQNRTMVFHIGRSDLRLVSPDKKQILLHKQLKDVIYCIQGKEEPDHFGVVCQDANGGQNSFVGYVFKCESESVASEIIGAVMQSHCTENRKKKKSVVVMSCEHCPMVWFHKLLNEIEDMKDEKAQITILKRIEDLPLDEQEMVLNKLNTTESLSVVGDNCAEQNQLLLNLLKAHCNSKQNRHVHDTAENRHEFLNHYLGGGTIFMKAKRSLTSSFDHLLKRKASKDDIGLSSKEFAYSTNDNLYTKESSFKSSASSTEAIDNKAKSVVTVTSPTSSDESSANELMSPQKILSSPKSMRDIFFKVGSSPRSSAPQTDNDSDDQTEQPASWRQTIFKNVVTPNKHVPSKATHVALDKSELRSLWKKAINQQILLIRMEKENAKLCARQEEATMKRIKLEYEDICASGKENTEIWDSIMNKGNRKYDDQMLLHAVRQGVPRSKRGEIWIFLAEQFCSKMPPPIDCHKFPAYNHPYDQLLKQLTSQQHAILIDLGRTFPNHTYFMSPLGPGQLALYNLLKAYSLLDEEVGYCQGLSFIAGVLLLHMSENEAFIMLRHLMFRRDLRRQYLPEMTGLQVQLYQLTRLLKDYEPELYEHFDRNEISPLLYAAPWILTIFASQFPLGFVVRVFDLIFAEGSDVLFKVILSLLSYHKDQLMQCDGFEQIMDYLKITITIIDKTILEYVVKQVCTMDVTKQLLEYSVEYNVLQEELATPRPETKKLKQLEETNKALKGKIQSLGEQLEIALVNNSRQETVRIKHLSQINKLESEVRALEVTVRTLGQFVSSIAYARTDIEVPTDVLRILSQLNVADRRKSLSKNIDSKERAMGHQKDDKDGTVTLGQIKSNSSSKYFANTFEQLRHTKSMSDSKHTAFDRIAEETDRTQSLGRVLNPKDMETVKMFQKNYKNERTLKSSKSSFELGSNIHTRNCSESQYPFPLDCGGVQISFSGTTKLKSLRPRTKSDYQIHVPKHLIESPSPSDNNDSAFDESMESIDANGNKAKVNESFENDIPIS